MPATRCFGCGETGHFERDCPNTSYLGENGKNAWCGICDERTRLIDKGASMSRCRDCHPHRHRQLPQHKKCPSCHMTIFLWANSSCGQHHTPQLAGATH